MIKLEIDGKDYDLDDDLRSRIVDRIGGLDEYMDTLDEGHVTVAWKGGPHEQTKVSAEVWGGGDRFDASDTDWKPVTAIDQTREKLYAQIRKEHGKDVHSHDRHRK